jgi:hypothetical protein
MKVHLRGDEIDDTTVKFTVFINDTNCGQLCMSKEEAIYFHDLVVLTDYKIPEDILYSSGKWK